MRQQRSRLIDAAFYLGFGLDAAYTAVFSEFYGFRVWGNFAVVGYAFAFLHTAILLLTRREGSRWIPVGYVVALGMVVPMLVLVFKRMTGRDWGSPAHSMTAQPEVWVIERAGRLLWATGSPYVDLSTLNRPPVVDDYTPYSPAMALLGLPNALFGRSVVTDARIVAFMLTVVIFLLILKALDWPSLSVRPVQFVALTTFTTLSAAVAGNDMPVVALLVLGAVLAMRSRPEWAALVLALASSMKLTALPAAVVVAVALAFSWRFLATFVAGMVVFTGLSAATNWEAFVDNVIRFPANMAAVRSPAGSPLPGHLLEQTGPVGHTAVLVLLALAAVGMLWWLLARPPRTTAEILLRTGVGLGVAMLLMPATRWGYLIYPIALLGAALYSWRPARQLTQVG
ncbi:glycosyltransferase 87 family protein [Kibdelosporangium persicum]|uniref:Phosphatidylinositol alpha-1,6-mannosyltransferase n=1 Tax=Kibdelosporangium persicum TaxID=2698649 RepID=A0ABX2F0N2_9PSEU|nr:glycosyltransferase 87 family protein [Kibdelosporangium persicum]NRN64773.1 Phosphatidylinositol alpha-1,6-mannosyltransferase [Kibdelosporangium persicum]